jgi:hypothetical protein
VILKQFVDNFRLKAQALGGATESPETKVEVNESPSVGSGNELNGLAIFWSLLKSWIGGLFGKKPVG